MIGRTRPSFNEAASPQASSPAPRAVNPIYRARAGERLRPLASVATWASAAAHWPGRVYVFRFSFFLSLAFSAAFFTSLVLVFAFLFLQFSVLLARFSLELFKIYYASLNNFWM
jgi:hypothetical protein